MGKLDAGRTPDFFQSFQNTQDKIDQLSKESAFGPAIVDNLPTNGLFEGRQVFLRSGDARIHYIYSNDKWRVAGDGWSRIGTFTKTATYLEYASVPQTFTHLQVRFAMQSNRAGSQNTGMRLRINGATGNWYNFIVSYQANVNGTVGLLSSTNRLLSSWYVGQAPAANRTSDDLTAMAIIDFPYYCLANYGRNYTFQSAGDDGTNVLWATGGGAFVQNANPISSIIFLDDVSGNLGPRCYAELWAV